MVVFWFLIIMVACVPLNLSDYTVPEEPPGFLAKKTIAVLPFRGSVAVLEPTGEWFAHKLAMSGKLKVISPEQSKLLLLENERTSALQWKNPQEAADIGRTIGADLVIIGSLYTKPCLIQWDAVCKVALIDTRNGEEIGTYEGVDMINNWDPALSYMRAANKAAYEIIGSKKIPQAPSPIRLHYETEKENPQ